MARLKGKLGKALQVPGQCYAGPVLGGCGSKLTQEHPLSETLRKGTELQVLVHDQPRGTSIPTMRASLAVSMRQASAPILCDRHNGALSPVDTTAKDLSQALREAARRTGSSMALTEQARTLDGHLFARWLCKYHSGCSVMLGRTPHPDFVRYAFGEPTLTRLYFLFPIIEGIPLQPEHVGDMTNTPLQMWHTPQADREVFYVVFEGLHVLVSTLRSGPDLDDIYDELPFPNGTLIVDRLRRLTYPAAQLSISLDWGGDPDDPRVLDASGKLVASRQ